MPITNRNIKGGWITATFFGDGFISLNSTNSAVAANTSNSETVNEMWINSIDVNCGGSNGVFVTVKRGANTVWQGGGQAYHDFSDGRAIDNVGGNLASNVVITKVGTGPVWLAIKLHKRSSITGGSQY